MVSLRFRRSKTPHEKVKVKLSVPVGPRNASAPGGKFRPPWRWVTTTKKRPPSREGVGMANGVIGIGFVRIHNLGDLEGTHRFGPHTNIAIRLDNGGSDTSGGGEGESDHQGRDGIRTYVAVLFIAYEKWEVMWSWIPQEGPDNPRRVIRNNTRRLRTRASGRSVVNEITKSKGAWGVAPPACGVWISYKWGPPGVPTSRETNTWRAGRSMRKTPVS